MTIVLGSNSMWGNISAYQMTYLKSVGVDATVEQGVTVVPFTLITVTFFAPLGAILQQRDVNPKILFFISGFLIFIGVYTAADVKSWGGFLFWYAFVYIFA